MTSIKTIEALFMKRDYGRYDFKKQMQDHPLIMNIVNYVSTGKVVDQNYQFIRDAINNIYKINPRLIRTLDIKYADSEKDRSQAIKNFLRYRSLACIASHYYKMRCGSKWWKDHTVDIFDCDRSPLAISLYESLFNIKLTMQADDKGYIRYTGHSGIFGDMEGDTMNSFWTSYKKALQIVDKDEFKGKFFTEYCDGKTIPDDDINALSFYQWLLTDKVFEYFSEVNESDWMQNFASLTHTVGNFTLVPRGMNFGRYKFTHDYWDLFMIYLKEEYDASWFKSYVDHFILWNYLTLSDDKSVQVNKFFDHSLSSMAAKDIDIPGNILPDTLSQMEVCIKMINNMILNRAGTLFSTWIMRYNSNES